MVKSIPLDEKPSDGNSMNKKIDILIPCYSPFEDTEWVKKVYLNGPFIEDQLQTGYGWFIPLIPLLKRGENLIALKPKVTKTSDLDLYLW